MPELLIDFITSLDGYGAAEGWPGFWGLEGPEYLGWLNSDDTLLPGAVGAMGGPANWANALQTVTKPKAAAPKPYQPLVGTMQQRFLKGSR